MHLNLQKKMIFLIFFFKMQPINTAQLFLRCYYYS